MAAIIQLSAIVRTSNLEAFQTALAARLANIGSFTYNSKQDDQDTLLDILVEIQDSHVINFFKDLSLPVTPGFEDIHYKLTNFHIVSTTSLPFANFTGMLAEELFETKKVNEMLLDMNEKLHSMVVQMQEDIKFFGERTAGIMVDLKEYNQIPKYYDILSVICKDLGYDEMMTYVKRHKVH